MAALDAACVAIGRDPRSLVRSAMVAALVGADEVQVRERRDAMLRTFAISGQDAEAWYEGRRQRWIVGTPDDARAMVRRYAEAGVERLMLQDFLPWDLEMIELLGRELIGRV
jgi:alkanesulfonate monooxygenase SsuD/methylene tetrahydromethanopterin reductase-like flavin-dependent oxidoreductase (luciferase family)